MRNIYDLKQETGDLKDVRDVIATLERISAAYIPALRNHLNTLDDYVAAARNIYKKLGVREKKQNDEGNRELLIVFSTDRGLVGGLNGKITDSAAEYLRENPGSLLAVFGEKGKEFLQMLHFSPDLFFKAPNDKPEINEINDFFEQIFGQDFNFSRISVCAPQFVSVLEQKPEISVVWPADNSDDESENLESYSFVDPSRKRVAEFLRQKLLKLSIYEKALNAKLCEHAARMMAMSDAGKSAGKIIENLERQYFKSRQQMITKRLSEVFSAKQSLKQEV
ncbi:MAG TPA: F0F1 ATP synthase subunit gamma [Patescibacteria group bacterium]|nr:F0F1 ATP synthase subunit gamma [Patescibacteria group bacterium]